MSTRYLSASYEGFKTLPVLKGVPSLLTVPLIASFNNGFKIDSNTIRSSKTKGLYNVEVLATIKVSELKDQDLSLCLNHNNNIVNSNLLDTVSEGFKTIRFSNFVQINNKDIFKVMILNKTSNANIDIYSLKIVITEV